MRSVVSSLRESGCQNCRNFDPDNTNRIIARCARDDLTQHGRIYGDARLTACKHYVAIDESKSDKPATE